MEHTELLKRIEELEREIALLPRGSVAVKRINDKEYFYHRINENGKRRETYVDFEKAAELRDQIEKRKAMEKELKELKNQLPKEPVAWRRRLQNTKNAPATVRFTTMFSANSRTRFSFYTD